MNQSRSKSGSSRNPRNSLRSRSSPFTDFGSYMAEKNRKLRDQFEMDASSSSHGGGQSLDSGGRADGDFGGGIFRGVSIFVDGFTIPSSQDLKMYMLKHGGRFVNYFSRHTVTHIICSNLPDSKMKNLRAFSGGLPVVKPAWIVDSMAANTLLSWVPYQLMVLPNETCKQLKLSAFFPQKASIDQNNNSDPCNSLSDKQVDNDLSPFIENDNCSETKGVELSSNGETEGGVKEDEFELSDSDHRNSDDCSTSYADNVDSKEELDLKRQKLSHPPHSTITDPNFIENYFKYSRLHFIGTWRNRYRKRFANLLAESRTGSMSKLGNTDHRLAGQKSIIIHIDMDCFFVSVVIRNFPELLDKPVAVCHSDNPKGTAEISSANYSARDYGIRAGMFVRDAKARCPHLLIVPYDFAAYEEVADQFYGILHKHCNKVQALSCDEAYLDMSDYSNDDPKQLALMIRREIEETTRCTASAGIAENRLLARLATRSAKPNGQCFISPDKVSEYLDKLPITTLPGVGYSVTEKLKEKGFQNCGQLLTIPKDSLHKDFGKKMGDMLWNYCRGIDHSLVESVQETKSIGAEVNWGVRFKEDKDVD